MAKQIKGAGDVYEKDLYGDLRKSAKETLLFLEAINKALVDTSNLAAKSLNTKVTNLKELETVNNSVVKINKAFTQKVQIDQERLKLENRLKKANSDSIQQNEEVKVLLTEQNKINKQLAKEKLGLVGAYEKESKRLISLRKQYKDLALTEGETSDKARALRNEIIGLDSRLKSLDKTTGQSIRNVGNYSSGVEKLRNGFKSLVAAAGITTGVYAIANAFKDAFGRIRDFDKELATMAGIAGLTRKELKPVEGAIIRVAGESTKTSNEVAQLATTLFQLGKTSREVELLLKPINDLSIALRATSDETALFLGQTINAFGKGAESGQYFADIVSNIASSTALDFEGLSDSLGYVAPVANALNLTIGDTGAIIGVLNDNGIKAARSGRLMASSFARLVDKGLNLDQALDKINKSTNKVSTAADLFGTESFTLGLILADNIEKTKALGKEFDNMSEGALKKLTDEQLKSIDAQLKILDSTYEKFILNIENGEGILSDMFRKAIQGATGFISMLDNVSVSLKNLIKGSVGARAEFIKTVETSFGFETAFGTKLKSLSTAAEKITDEFAQRFLKKDKKQQDNIVLNLKNRITKNIKLLKGANAADSILIEEKVKIDILTLKKLQNARLKGIKEVEEATTSSIGKQIKKERELTGLIEKQMKVVSDLGIEIQRARTEKDIFNFKLQADTAQRELDRLLRIVNSTYEEIDRIENEQIQNTYDRTIQSEMSKSDDLIAQIESNSLISEEKKKELIKRENERLAKFVNEEEIKRGKASIELAKGLSEEEFKQRRTGFKTEKEFEEEKTKQLKAIEIKALKDELKLLEQFGDEESILRKEQIKSRIQELHDFNTETLKDFTDISQALLDKFEESIAKTSERRVNAIEDSISASEQQQDRLREIADKGVLGADQSLAAEEKKRAELERQKQEEIRKQELRTAGFRILSALLEQGKSPQEAIPEVGLLLGALPAIIDAIPTFIEGTEDVSKSLGKPQLSGQDGHIIRVDGKERIVDPENNRRMGGISNDEAARIVESYNKGMLTDLHRFNTPNVDKVLSVNWQSNEQVLARFESLESSVVKSNMAIQKAIENKPVLTDFEYLEMFKTIRATIQKGSKIERTTTKLNRLS